MLKEQISSDTNIWIDFLHIGKLCLPFKLECVYLMAFDAVQDELLSPPSLKEQLLSLGLQQTNLTTEEFYLADSFEKYKRLSIYDRMSLSIAKSRNLALLTGDKALRNAAQVEGLHIMGTLAVLDRLKSERHIEGEEYIECIRKLKELNGGVVRLPAEELEKRL